MKKIYTLLLLFALCGLSNNANSQNFQWAKHMGGNADAGGDAVAVDASKNVYTAGEFTGTVDFDPGPGTFNLTSYGGYDIFVSKLDSLGNFIWARQMGGPDDEEAIAIALDATGKIYTTGYFWGTANFRPDTGTYNLTSAGDFDAFCAGQKAIEHKRRFFIYAFRLQRPGGPGLKPPLAGGARTPAADFCQFYADGKYRNTGSADTGHCQ